MTFLKKWAIPVILALGLLLSISFRLDQGERRGLAQEGADVARSGSGSGRGGGGKGGDNEAVVREEIRYGQISPLVKGRMSLDDKSVIFCRLQYSDKNGKAIKTAELSGTLGNLPPAIQDMARRVGVGGRIYASIPYSTYFKKMPEDSVFPVGEDVRLLLEVMDSIPGGMEREANGKPIGFLVVDMDKNGVAETLKGGDWEKRIQKFKNTGWIDKNYTRPLKLGDKVENREWVGSNTGLFMIGKKVGEVTSEDLVGTYTGGMEWENAYEVLEQFDGDSSGRIEGSEMEGIFLWVDRNSDATVQEEEIDESSDALSSIVLMPSRNANGVWSRRTGGVKFKDGSVGATWEWKSKASWQ